MTVNSHIVCQLFVLLGEHQCQLFVLLGELLVFPAQIFAVLPILPLQHSLVLTPQPLRYFQGRDVPRLARCALLLPLLPLLPLPVIATTSSRLRRMRCRKGGEPMGAVRSTGVAPRALCRHSSPQASAHRPLGPQGSHSRLKTEKMSVSAFTSTTNIYRI